MLKTVIIDDEQNAIKTLSWELSQHKDIIDVIAVFTSPKKAIDYINANPIDCIFLDIEMPEMDGFQLLSNLVSKDFFLVITTAYNQYAIEAFKKEAIDYLLKPIDSEELASTLQKLLKQGEKSQITEKVEQTLLRFNEQLQKKKIVLNTNGKLFFLEPDEILYVSSDGNYSSIFLEQKNKEIVISKKIKDVEEMLPQNSFLRVHNSFIVNLNKVKEFLKVDGYLILVNGKKIPVSRQKKSLFLDRM